MLPLYIYSESLEIINGVKFTPREIDIIACILNGRSAKTIPTLLSIAQKTVSVHLENIRAKIGCPSRESIIDFIETSDKHSLIKNEYYSSLLVQSSFEKCLREISRISSIQGINILLLYQQKQNAKVIAVHYLEHHLKLAGFKVENKIQKEREPWYHLMSKLDNQDVKYTLCILAESLVNQSSQSHSDLIDWVMFVKKNFLSLDKTIFLLFNKTEDIEKLLKKNNIQYINFYEQKNYFSSFIKILKIALPYKGIDKVFSNFKQPSKGNNYITENPNILLYKKNNLKKVVYLLEKIISSIYSILFFKKRKYFSVGIVFCASVFFLYRLENKVIPYEITAENINKSSVRSDLVIPTESTLLNRPELLSQIDKSFKTQAGIQITAIIGIGGAGKTTLARQYAQQQKGQVVWEINADTKAHLNASFENLAHMLSQTDKEKKELRVIHDIKDTQEREEKLIQFVKIHLKLIPHWFLIFDNVEKLADIQNYFPRDTHTWGTGKIILTSQDRNLQNSNQIDHIFFIGELNEEQKLSLFSKIMNHGHPEPFSSTHIEETKQFLSKLPPFPLDISMAAYYLKVANISYFQYLGNLKKSSSGFDVVQNNILKEVGGYNKTRYGIITLSLKEITSHSKDFSDLFLFISLLNAQHIPRDLLEKYKNNLVVDSFLYHLKKYSLIVSEALPSLSSHSSICLHNSIQNISLPYLIQQFSITKGNPIIEEMAKTLDDYVDDVIEEENFPKMQHMAGHLKKFLSHSNLLTDLSKVLLESKLGCLYYFINNEKEIQKKLNILRTKKFEKLHPKDHARIARTFLHIGAVYTELRLYREAQELFENAINIYGQEELINYAELSWALSHLGNVHRRLGNYEKAKEYLEKSIHLHKHHGSSAKRLARTLAYLGSVYRGLGYYQKSIDILKESLALYQGSGFNHHYRAGWILMQLGNVFRKMGDLKKAKSYLEAGNLIVKQYFSENHMSIGLSLAYLGNYHRELGQYEESRNYLEQSLKIHQKHFDESHARIGWIIFHLANTYKCLEKYEKSSRLFDKVLQIYNKYCNEGNIESARMLRDMAEICLEKNRLDEAENFIKRSLKILKHRDHVETYMSLTILGELFLKKSMQLSNAKHVQKRKALKTQALSAFTQALKITEQHLPKGSIHIQKIRFRIKNLQEKKL